MELQQGSKQAYPDELIHVSDSGGREPLTLIITKSIVTIINRNSATA
ncbi:hypothetical protein CEQ20_17860 [Yersinia pseudotuberculosis]|nr:hypothetical protein CEQ20_17860 [Yersinia pseudotuberculosis]AYX10712.1 hypothetical protein EGX52_07910 [Yersinia pseudotuberculosis]MBO1566307.1 hypothetical protein [Yersinia pseudotuberculosis]MBO1589505.1 hypothetical protein [Yersinia pseudotuberculosis]MBO1603248.1 hypothetical protein [Yersinia pseudotuberculosis]